MKTLQFTRKASKERLSHLWNIMKSRTQTFCFDILDPWEPRVVALVLILIPPADDILLCDLVLLLYTFGTQGQWRTNTIYSLYFWSYCMSTLVLTRHTFYDCLISGEPRPKFFPFEVKSQACSCGSLRRIMSGSGVLVFWAEIKILLGVFASNISFVT